MKLFKKNKFLFVYIIVIVIILLFILFLIPDSFIKKYSRFRSFYDKDGVIIEPSDDPITIPYEIEIQNLQKKKYSYEYLIDYNNTVYRCKGTKDGDYDGGRCTSPTEVEYTTSTYKDVYKDIDTNLLDVDYIFNMIKDSESIKTVVNGIDIYTYEIPKEKDSISISICSNGEYITEIRISRGYYVYQLKYFHVEVS
jgi:hypothetical protein